MRGHGEKVLRRALRIYSFFHPKTIIDSIRASYPNVFNNVVILFFR